MRLGVTPVPVPNTMVKTQTADGTILETVWESRWPPIIKKNNAGSAMSNKKSFLLLMTDPISQRDRVRKNKALVP